MHVRRSINNIVAPIRDSEATRDRSTGVKREETLANKSERAMRAFGDAQRKPVERFWPEADRGEDCQPTGPKLVKSSTQESEARYRAFFECAPIGMFQVSPSGRVLDLNKSMAEMLGYESPEAVMHEGARDNSPILFWVDLLVELESRHKEDCTHSRVDLQVRCRNGQRKWARFNVRTVWEDGSVVRLEGTAWDITDQKEAEIRTELLAYYDLVTGLPNRTQFQAQLAEELAAAREKKRRVALLQIELEGFKVINDSLGDAFGDRLLQEVAARIMAGTSEGGSLARIGGTEFAVILPDVDDVREVDIAAENLVTRLNDEYCFLGHALSVLCSVGVSVYPENGADCETLMRRSDIAVRRAREDKLARFTVFTDAMNEELVARLRLENGLREVLSRKELFLEYQPQVDIRTGEIIGVESLLRWNHHELGLIPPNDFIGIAENTGLIVSIGEWALRSACSQARAWQQEGLPAVPVAVNVSPIQFHQQGFCELIGNVLRETGLSPELLELELTESLLTDAEVVSPITARLRALGVTLAIDDFGTGYSSLGYLKHFKVNRLKIDRSFIKDVSVDADDTAITIAIIEMARALNLSVLAEGVEEESQLSFLLNQGCYGAQGFYFSKPISAGKISELLRTGFGHWIPPTTD